MVAASEPTTFELLKRLFGRVWLEPLLPKREPPRLVSVGMALHPWRLLSVAVVSVGLLAGFLNIDENELFGLLFSY